MNQFCDNCGKLGDGIKVIGINFNRGWKFWKPKYHVLAKFCCVSCLQKYTAGE